MLMKTLLNRVALWSVVALVGFVISTEFRPAKYHALLCTDPAAVQAGEWNFRYDGFYIGADGCLYDPSKTSLEDVPPVIGDNATTDRVPLLYVNGANHRVDWTMPELHILAEDSERPVIGIYNATAGGRFPDAITDSLAGDQSRVVETLETIIWQAFERGEEVHLKANSQGAVHSSNALFAVSAQLHNQFGAERAKELLSKVHLETAGGAATHYPDGPRYLHYVNERDPVPRAAGVMVSGSQPGTNAVIATFTDLDIDPLEPKYRWVGPLTMRFIAAHGFMVYQYHRRPFERVYAASRDGSVRYVSLDGAPIEVAQQQLVLDRFN